MNRELRRLTYTKKGRAKLKRLTETKSSLPVRYTQIVKMVEGQEPVVEIYEGSPSIIIKKLRKLLPGSAYFFYALYKLGTAELNNVVYVIREVPKPEPKEVKNDSDHSIPNSSDGSAAPV